MFRRWHAIPASCCALAAFLIGPGGEEPPAARPKLPGARPEIRAAEFASLQAAIDALPAEGGTVVIPPGRFELSEPLVRRKAT